MEPKVGSLKLTKFIQTDLDKWGKTQITKIRNKSGGITTDLTEIKIITREYSEQLYTNKLDNLDEASENAMAPHSSTLAWKIPWTVEPGRLQSMGSLRVGCDWATSLLLFTFMHWRRKWQPTPVFLPGESQGRGSLVGCRLWGRTESDTTEAT